MNWLTESYSSFLAPTVDTQEMLMEGSKGGRKEGRREGRREGRKEENGINK